MMLTMQRITRDDVYDFKRKYEAYNNDRGRGGKNRTHDVSISDCKVYPVNLIDRDEVWKFSYLDYPCMVIEHRDDEKTTEHGTSCYIRKEYKQLQGPPTLSTYTEVLKNDMGLCGYGKVTEKMLWNMPSGRWNIMERMDFTASINHSVRRRKLTDGKCIPQSMPEQNGITSFPKSKKTVGMTGEPIRTKRKHAQTWKFSRGNF